MSIGLYIVLAPLYLKSVRKLQEKRFVFVKILAIIIPENGAKVSKIKCFQFAQQTLIMDKLAHASQKVGLASAMAVVLLIIILLVTFIQKAAFKYFFGEGEQEAIRTVRKRKKLAKKEQKELSVNLNREVSRNVSGKA